MTLSIGLEKEAGGQSLTLSKSGIQGNSCLPHEVLATIFIHYAHEYHSGHPGYPTRTVPMWVNVSYVCRYWRDVALNCPSLWTYVFMTSLRWTEELLARSRQASLRIRIRLVYVHDAPRWLASLEKVMEHVERIQLLRLELPASNAQRILSKLDSRAPRLQNLQIEISLRSRSLQSSSVFFNGDTPSLRSLEFSDCPVPWYSFKLGALTTLSLHRVPALFQQNMEMFLATLSHMQDLRYLYLDHALSSATGFLSSAAFNTFQKINLSHLSRLSVTAPLSTVIALLSCVNTPSKTEIRLKCLSQRHSSLNDYSLLPSLLAQRFIASEHQALSGLAIHSFSVDSARQSTTITFSTSQRDCDFFFSISHGEWDRGIPLKINIEWVGSLTLSDRERVINDVCCSMPLTDVQSVHLIDPPSFPAFWRQTLGTLQDLRYIKLSGGSMPDLASELSVIKQESMEGQSGPTTGGQYRGHVLAPQLEELELYQITFPLTGFDSSRPELAITRHNLIDALSTRQGPQGRLTMTRCRIGASDGFDMVLLWGDGDVRVVSENDSDSDAPQEDLPGDD
ncbi:hypothetical protein V8E55_001455 [Tylopilus felleus]